MTDRRPLVFLKPAFALFFALSAFLFLGVGQATASACAGDLGKADPFHELAAKNLEAPFHSYPTLRLFGGASRLSGSDLDLYLESAIYSHSGPSTEAVGNYLPIHWGFDVGAELTLNVHPRLGFGIRLGRVSTFDRTSTFRFAAYVPSPLPPNSYTALFMPSVGATSVLLGVHYGFIMSPVIRVEAIAAAGPLFGTVGLDIRRTGNTFWVPDSQSWQAKRTALALEGGLNMAVNLGRRIALVGEALWRQASLNAPQGRYVEDGVVVDNAFMWIDSEIPNIVVFSSATSFPGPFRKADVSLSGFSLRLGLEWRFAAF